MGEKADAELLAVAPSGGSQRADVQNVHVEFSTQNALSLGRSTPWLGCQNRLINTLMLDLCDEVRYDSIAIRNFGASQQACMLGRGGVGGPGSLIHSSRRVHTSPPAV